MSWFFFAFLASAIWGVSYTVDKFLLSARKISPLLMLVAGAVFGILFAGFLFCTGRGVIITGWPLLLALASGVLYGIQFLLGMKAIKGEEVSRVVPVFYTTPAFSLILSGVFLAEKLSRTHTLGIGLLMVGAILISTEPGKWFRFSRSGLIMLAAAFVYGVFSVVTKSACAQTTYWTVFAFMRIGVFLFAVLLSPWWLPDLRKQWQTQKGTFTWLGANEVITLVAMLSFTIAISLGSATLVNAVGSTTPFFVLVYATAITRVAPHVVAEKSDARTIAYKAIAIVVMFAGVLLVT